MGPSLAEYTASTGDGQGASRSPAHGMAPPDVMGVHRAQWEPLEGVPTQHPGRYREEVTSR